jgi:hypothetical protein
MSISYYLVNERFPCLTRKNVPKEIRSVQYDIDLDLVDESSIDISTALEQLGVI